ncbi:hypothetical protein AB5I41_19335 [Sphingomonas sp. MMS24-JH45]
MPSGPPCPRVSPPPPAHAPSTAGGGVDRGAGGARRRHHAVDARHRTARPVDRGARTRPAARDRLRLGGTRAPAGRRASPAGRAPASRRPHRRAATGLAVSPSTVIAITEVAVAQLPDASAGAGLGDAYQSTARWRRRTCWRRSCA